MTIQRFEPNMPPLPSGFKWLPIMAGLSDMPDLDDDRYHKNERVYDLDRIDLDPLRERFSDKVADAVEQQLADGATFVRLPVPVRTGVLNALSDSRLVLSMLVPVLMAAGLLVMTRAWIVILPALIGSFVAEVAYTRWMQTTLKSEQVRVRLASDDYHLVSDLNDQIKRAHLTYLTNNEQERFRCLSPAGRERVMPALRLANQARAELKQTEDRIDRSLQSRIRYEISDRVYQAYEAVPTREMMAGPWSQFPALSEIVGPILDAEDENAGGTDGEFVNYPVAEGATSQPASHSVEPGAKPADDNSTGPEGEGSSC